MENTGKGRDRTGKLVRWYPAEDGTMSGGLGQEFCYLPISKLDRVKLFRSGVLMCKMEIVAAETAAENKWHLIP